jgi:multimeric flavodoxin WrbA
VVYKVVGVIGSPRKRMNTDTLVTKALEGASSVGAEIEKVYLNDLNIMPCQACKKHPAPDYCFYHDGMDKIYNVLENADGLIIGTPAYFACFSAQLKLMIDRSNCLAEMITKSDGKLIFKSRLKKRKKAIFIWVANISKDPEHAIEPIRIWCKYFANVEIVEKMIILNSDLGKGARNNTELLKKAFILGKTLVN